MRLKILRCSVLCSFALIATGCSRTTEENNLEVSGSTSALSSIHLVEQVVFSIRPSASLGVYVAQYLAQGIYLPARTALAGIDAQWDIITGADDSGREEVFLLLEELGSLLQVNVPDMLNRSANRPDALNEYVDALRSATRATDQKRKELTVLLEEQENTTKEEKRITNDLEKEVRDATKNEDYSTAGRLQEDLIKQKAILAEAEAQEDQTSEILESYDDLVTISVERLNAIARNRDAILAGVTVMEVPGIDDLDLLEKVRRSRDLEREILEGL